MRETFLKVEVAMGDLNMQTYTSSPKYDWSILISNIGGQLGLCIGFSIFTGLEIVELMIDLLCHICCKLKNSVKVTEKTPVGNWVSTLDDTLESC